MGINSIVVSRTLGSNVTTLTSNVRDYHQRDEVYKYNVFIICKEFIFMKKVLNANMIITKIPVSRFQTNCIVALPNLKIGLQHPFVPNYQNCPTVRSWITSWYVCKYEFLTVCRSAVKHIKKIQKKFLIYFNKF